MRPEVAVGAVIVHDGRLALVRRAHEPGAGRWSLPGGRVEAGETLYEAVVREVAEETGLAVAVDRFLGWVERIDPARGHHFVILDFMALPEDPEPTLTPSDDVDRAEWVDMADLEHYETVDGLLEFLEDHGIIEGPRTFEL